jgi:hypothetical protein
MKKINLYFIEVILLQLIDGVYETFEDDMSHFEKHIYRLKNQLVQTESVAEIQKIRSDLRIILNNKDRIDFKELYYNSFDVFPETDQEPVILLIKFWDIFFPNETWFDPSLIDESLIFYRDKLEYEEGETLI